MKFVGVLNTANSRTITVDGYSNKKTALGAIKEMGRFIADTLGYEDEGNCIVKYGLESLCPNCYSGPDQYCLEVEEVPCACMWDERKDEMRYAEGRWYVMCRFVK